MYGNSRVVTSAQMGIHERLATLVERHRKHPFLKPIAFPSQQAFDALRHEFQELGWASSQGRLQRPLILDSGCGVGWSTMQLARHYPDHLVLGVDQSSDRINRNKTLIGGLMPENCRIVRADLVDFWRLLLAAGWFPEQHYLLYPNPWPKIGHLARRWHAHPVFPALIALGGRFECRSNWKTYIEEMAWAVRDITGVDVDVMVWNPEVPLTPFEKKYQDSGHGLFRLVSPLALAGTT